MMDQKEKIRTQIEAKLQSFNQTLTEVKTHAEKTGRLLNEDTQHPLPMLRKKMKTVRQKMEALEDLPKEDWTDMETELERMMHDIDDGLQKALKYYH